MAVAGELVIKTKVDNSGVEKGLKETDAILEENNNKTGENEDVQKRIAEAQERIKKAQEGTKQAEESIAKSKQATLEYTEEISRIEEQNEAIKENLQNQKEIQKKVEEIGNSIQKTTKKVVKWGLAILGVQGVFSFIRSSMNTIAQNDKQLASDIEYMKNALAYSLEPIIRVIVELMKQLLYLVGAVIKVATGFNIFENANKSLKNANKQAGALKKQLAGFDEMNIISDTSSSNANITTPSFDLSNLDVMTNKIKEIINQWKQFGEEMKYSIFNVDTSKWIEAFGNWGYAVKGVTQIVYGLWEVTDGLIKFVSGGVKVLVGIITNNSELVDEGIREMGDGLWEFIDGIINIIIGAIRTAIGIIIGIILYLIDVIHKDIDIFINSIKGAWKGLRGFLPEPFQILGDTITRVLNNSLSNVSHWFGIIKGIFTGDWKSVMDNFKQIFKNTFDSLWTIAKTPLNLIISGVNKIIDGLNSLSIDIPDWVPGVGGQTWGINIPKIPKLAKGGIVNNPGSGVLMGSYIVGEKGPEAVIPLDDDTLDRLGLAFARHTQINATVPVYVGNRQIAREIRKINAEDDFAFNG